MDEVTINRPDPLGIFCLDCAKQGQHCNCAKDAADDVADMTGEASESVLNETADYLANLWPDDRDTPAVPVVNRDSRKPGEWNREPWWLAAAAGQGPVVNSAADDAQDIEQMSAGAGW